MLIHTRHLASFRNSEGNINLHIGSGTNYKPGYVNIDYDPMMNADLYLDLNEEQIPFPDSVVHYVFSHHAIEHIENFLWLMEELYRVCKPNALMKITVPYVTTTEHNLINPFHKTHFTEHKFRFFDDIYRGYKKVCIKTEQVDIEYNDEFKDKSHSEQEYARKHYFNVVRQINFRLRIMK